MVWSSFGKFAVGFTEAEWDRREEGQPVAGRLFYPAPPQAKLPAGAAGWLQPWRWRAPLTRGVPWLPHINYARGLGKFLFFRLHGRMYSLLEQVLVAFAWATGKAQRLDLLPGAPLAPGAPEQLPLVIFSHGLGGNRFLYSVICSELASQGYVVLAVEHADGTACAAKLPGERGWKLYGGLGNEAAQVDKTRVRVSEMKAGLQMMQAIHRGDRVPGMKLSHGLQASNFLCGRIDLRCVAAAGHSYGGATTAALIAEDPLFRCGVTLDPWWYAVYPESKVLHQFETRTPLLIMGSHDWNVPNAFGQLACGGERQEKVLAAARVRGGAGQERTGGGAMLLSIAGSSHNTFADALPLFGQKTGWLLERLGLTARLDPLLGIYLCTTATLNFLSLHLPLTPEQRGVQNWEPAKRHAVLDRILERDVADSGAAPPGLLAWMFPGRGLVNAASDYLLNRSLPVLGTIQAMAKGGAPARPVGSSCGKQQPLAAQEANGSSEPSDVLTGLEAAEAAMPSANPASGPLPHAPGAAAQAAAATPNGGMEPAGVNGGGGGELELSAAQRAQLRAAVNQRYSGTVEAAEVAEMHALLGSRHIFKCFTV